MTDILEVYRRYGVAYRTEGDGKVTRGWAGCACPFCRSPGLHLGVNLEGLFWSCWRCGHHDPVSTLAALCRLERRDALRLWEELSPRRGAHRAARRDAEMQARIASRSYKRPSGVVPLTGPHRRYLERRGFDPDRLAAEWGVMSTGPASYLDHLDYSHRIFVPIVWDGHEVSFQARDATGRASPKYRACPAEREAVHHRDILYLHPDPPRSRVGIAVEGVTDAWRLGPRAFALFGTQYARAQVLRIAERYDRVAVVFDGGEPSARHRAIRLSAQLEAVRVSTEVVELPPGVDPGSMSDEDAASLVKMVA